MKKNISQSSRIHRRDIVARSRARTAEKHRRVEVNLPLALAADLEAKADKNRGGLSRQIVARLIEKTPPLSVPTATVSVLPETGDGPPLRDILATAPPSAVALLVCSLLSKRGDAQAALAALENSARVKRMKMES